jgi:biopolymer transport protein ExbD/biopolymer transport protein TolR
MLGEPAKIQATINITPLVDVVLVLLIIFMVVAPQMLHGPEVDLPDTQKPTEQGDNPEKVLVTITERGDLWIDDQQVPIEHFGEGLQAAAAVMPNAKVSIRGDAQLRFGDVRRTMLAIDEAGFRGVGLVAKKRAGADVKGD